MHGRLSPDRPLAAMLVGLTVASVLGVVGCGPAPVRGASGGRLSVVASFYPLAWMAQEVGGDQVVVSTLTRPGAEPHDLELVPRDVARVVSANVVVYLSGFQPSVDTAVADAAGSLIFDARPAADLDLTFTPVEDGRLAARRAGSTDPHFWLDPLRLSRVATAFAAQLGRVDVAHRDRYRANAEALAARLDGLDQDYRAGLDRCARRDLVTSHNAFGYLARRYRLAQRPITGLSAEDEPSPAELADVTDFVTRHRVRTIYFETLVSPATARTVAREAGVAIAVLDPIEGLNDRSTGSDYLSVMAANLATLRRGQSCR